MNPATKKSKMKRWNVTLRLVSAALALCFAVLACSLPNTTSVGDLNTATKSVDAGGVDSASVQIAFPAGELSVASGAESLMDASFRYNVAQWQPQVSYTTNGNKGKLVIDTNGKDFPVGKEVIYEWDIRLNGSLPLDVEITTGAGMSDLSLGDLDLSSLRLEVGAGTTTLDLSGSWDHDVTANVTGGVGQLSIKLPADMGVRVNTKTALVNTTTVGLDKDNQGYINQAYGTAAHTLTLNIEAGIGSIALAAP